MSSIIELGFSVCVNEITVDWGFHLLTIVHVGSEEAEVMLSINRFPIEWLMEYLQHKPEALRYLLERTVDRNGDGHVSASEMASSFQD